MKERNQDNFGYKSLHDKIKTTKNNETATHKTKKQQIKYSIVTIGFFSFAAPMPNPLMEMWISLLGGGNSHSIGLENVFFLLKYKNIHVSYVFVNKALSIFLGLIVAIVKFVYKREEVLY
jgi:hypothetical protein